MPAPSLLTGATKIPNVPTMNILVCIMTTPTLTNSYSLASNLPRLATQLWTTSRIGTFNHFASLYTESHIP